ncbi:MAG: baseplate J/gp47 family protein [Proteobacteria bacterium]|nr:baseplate J/gp47 family protein [Pseudomonadota bacterium]
MSLTTPTTKDISDNIIAQLEASFNQTIPLLPKSFNRVLSKVLGGLFVILYKYGGSIFLNVFVQTASFKDTTILGITVNPLTFWGRLIGVGDPVAATSAEFDIIVTVTNQVGSLPSNTQLINSDNGVTYITVGAVLLNADFVTAHVIAASDQAGGDGSGALGNLSIGDSVSFANPIPNVFRTATVSTLTVTGANAESADAYRQRVIDRFQKRPQGGAYADYEIWGEETAGIINIYPYTSDCPGQIDVYVEATPESSGDPDGIPTTAQLNAVLDSIELDQSGLASRRPAGSLVNAFAITRVPFDVVITGLTVDNLATVQANITAALTEYFLERDPYIEGLSILPRLDRVSSSAVGGVIDDVVSAAGGVFTSIEVSKFAIPFDIYTLDIGEKAKLNTATYN